MKHFLDKIGLEKEFYNYLCEKLKHWSASSHEKPIYQEHGIPQGPLPSGIISECVLGFFDANIKNTKKVKYFRYVDDIRLMAKSEKDLRQQLISLDLLSKNIGLFPQSSKIDIHKITNINKEIKSISNPPEVVTRPADPDQKKVRKRIIELSKRFKVDNETRFKYVLGAAKSNAGLHKRLLSILEKQPHLYMCILKNLSKSKRLTQNVSRECIKLLKNNTLYASYTSKFIEALHGRLHTTQRFHLTRFCQKYYRTKNPELKAIIAKILIDTNSLSYKQKNTLIQYKNWWTRSIVTSYLREDFIGKPSYETLVNKLLRDKVRDVSIVAADCSIKNNLRIHKPSQNISKSAQFSLKKAGMIGRVSSSECFISDAIIEVLSNKAKDVDWRKILGKVYKELLPKFVRWRGYSDTDPTAWVNITDTINDSLLAILFTHDGKIGRYKPGNIGGALSLRSRFAKKYPDLHAAVSEIHRKRLESDLSHPKNKATGKTTRYIEWKELVPLKKLLMNGYLELWRKW